MATIYRLTWSESTWEGRTNESADFPSKSVAEFYQENDRNPDRVSEISLKEIDAPLMIFLNVKHNWEQRK